MKIQIESHMGSVNSKNNIAMRTRMLTVEGMFLKLAAMFLIIFILAGCQKEELSPPIKFKEQSQQTLDRIKSSSAIQTFINDPQGAEQAKATDDHNVDTGMNGLEDKNPDNVTDKEGDDDDEDGEDGEGIHISNIYGTDDNLDCETVTDKNGDDDDEDGEDGEN